jgi:predicted secreted protein
MKKFLAALSFVLSCSLAHAADGAKFRAIGFSKDSRYFAFEQYGVQDGSGFAYTDIFMLDLSNDSWVKGSPITVLVEEEAQSVRMARAKAKLLAADGLKTLAIEIDAELLAANPFTEVSKDKSSMTFHDHFNNSMGIYGDSENQGTWDLMVSNTKVPLPAGCEDDMGIVGFKLVLKNNKSGATALLHDDKTIPKSRFCPVGYDVEAIVQPVGGSDSGQMVAIIGVSRRGFEGADRRFLAVPFKQN